MASLQMASDGDGASSDPRDVLNRFDEENYLKNNPDVADAVSRGDWHSGRMHYAISGFRSGRVACAQVDAEWYASSYPMVALELERGLATSIEEHYFNIGQYRGYIPNPRAKRADDAATHRSRFGGLWTDFGNAADVVEGRLSIGEISEADADLLRAWIRDGYVIIPQAVSEQFIDAAQADLALSYAGGIPDLRFAIHGIGPYVPWAEAAQSAPAKALDVHWFSTAIRNIIFAPKITRFLHLIFQRRSLATQTLGFWRGSQQNAHQDSAYVAYTLPMQFAASWIALEDVQPGAGELFYHPGSHRIAEYFFAGRFKSTAEASRNGQGGNEREFQVAEHVDRIRRQVEGLGLGTGKLIAKRGDALVWAADLAHGGSIISADKTRQSVVTHYCPSDCAPLYFERARCELRNHGQEYFSSGYYGRLDGPTGSSATTS